MAWPSLQDYNEAIQSPRLCFADSELQAGTPATNVLGLPQPITGAFASVYQMQCGTQAWAVRCFQSECTDQQKRYAAISQHLSSVQLPYTVGFEFVQRGIKVRGDWYPILKMEWVQGENLNVYIQKHLGSASALLDLAGKWAAMVKALEQANIAHGDFQHGNILVANGDLKLIDYDAMFVPTLAGSHSHEIGHRNYQHPNRTGADFGAYLDHFSGWVIYVSLVALSIEPNLWTQAKAGDEHLLFRKEDFDQPSSSSILMQLSKHSDTRIQHLVSYFQSLLYLSPQDVPSLDGSIAIFQAVPNTSTPVDGAGWWVSHTQSTSVDQPASTVQDTTAGKPSSENSTWVLDFLTPPEPPKSFSVSLAAPRIYIAICLLTCIVVALTLNLAVISMTLLVSVITSWAVLSLRFRMDPSVSEMLTLSAREKQENSALKIVEETLNNHERQKAKLRAEESEKKNTQLQRSSNLQKEEQRELLNIRAKLKQAEDGVNVRRLTLNQNEANALRKVQADIGSKVTALNRQISSLDQARADESDTLLKARQSQFLDDYLRRHRIWDASLVGIGDSFKQRLQLQGFVTAADVDYWGVQNVEGIGPARANTLSSWRISLEASARSRMPATLTALEIKQMNFKYTSQRTLLEAQRDNEQGRLNVEENAVRARYKAQKQTLDAELATVQNGARQAQQPVSVRYANLYAEIKHDIMNIEKETVANCGKIDEIVAESRKQLSSCHWQLGKTRRELEAYKELTFKMYMLNILYCRQVSSTSSTRS